MFVGGPMSAGGWQNQRSSEIAGRVVLVERGAGRGRLGQAVVTARARKYIRSRRTGAEGGGAARACGRH
jgi:hypothetical protein